MLVGGVGIGLYLRHKQSGSSEGEEEGEEGYVNSGNLMPPAAPIETGSGGGGIGGGGIGILGPASKQPEPPKLEPREEEPSAPEEPELPESKPPPEAVVTHPGNPPAHENTPITAPPSPEVPGSSKNEGLNEHHKVPTGPPVKVGGNQPVAPPANQQEKEKARNEINRLQGEIDGLQNHINQLTQVIQEHPKAAQRGQWESERNQDRANIEGKRNLVYWWSAQ